MVCLKDAAAMLVVKTIEANLKYFVNDHQHGGDVVSCKGDALN